MLKPFRSFLLPLEWNAKPWHSTQVLHDSIPACPSSLTSYLCCRLSVLRSFCMASHVLSCLCACVYPCLACLTTPTPLTLQRLKCLWSSRTLFTHPYPQFGLGSPALAPEPPGLSLWAHAYYTQDTWHLAAFMDVRMLAQMPAFPKSCAFSASLPSTN